VSPGFHRRGGGGNTGAKFSRKRGYLVEGGGIVQGGTRLGANAWWGKGDEKSRKGNGGGQGGWGEQKMAERQKEGKREEKERVTIG